MNTTPVHAAHLGRRAHSPPLTWLHVRRLLLKIVGSQTEVLQRRLIEHRGRELEGVGGAALRTPSRIAGERPVQNDRAIVHRRHGIPDEGKHRAVECLAVGKALTEDEVLRCRDRFARHVVRVHPLPAARQGCPMEVQHQPKGVGVSENVLVELHGGLLVAAEEVHFETLHANGLEPGHLTLSGRRGVHAMQR